MVLPKDEIKKAIKISDVNFMEEMKIEKENI